MSENKLKCIENNYIALRCLVGELFLTDKFMDLIELLLSISKNKLIFDNLKVICDGVENGNVDKILELIYELLVVGEKEGKQGIRQVAPKHGL